jgi:hypothetical protein
MDAFAQALSCKLQEELNKPQIKLQFVSALAWFKNRSATTHEVSADDLPIYRLQLLGYFRDDEVRSSWNTISRNFNPKVLEERLSRRAH